MKLNDQFLKGFVSPEEIENIAPEILSSHRKLHEKNGPGSDFLGWMTLPLDYDREEFSRIKKAAKKISSCCDLLVVIGIGGSYLGSRAVIELLQSPFYNQKKKNTPDIYFAGNNMDPEYLNQLLSICEGRDICINVISKSGTTTEPALAFRVFKTLLEKKYGKNGAKSRIFCTTDRSKGTLKSLADSEGYETFVIPDDVGGRFSVLTAVGLLPLAAAGCDIDALMCGAKDAMDSLSVCDISKNDCYRYAAVRNVLYRKGKTTELLVSYNPAFAMMSEWFKQLFGESEGKSRKGIFPAACIFSTDLHSLGQYIQDGLRNLFETVVLESTPARDFFIEPYENDFDGLNFLSGQNLSSVNRKAFEGTVLAHTGGGVPNIVLETARFDAYNAGYMIYFFEKACGISGYTLGVNPFDQPGVESYKKNMFALLGKPGYESEKAALEAKIKA